MKLITSFLFIITALQNLRRLNLDSVQLTPPLVPVKPSSFRNLEVLDLSRTRLCDQM